MLPIPENYSRLLQVRKSENVKLKPCKFIKSDVTLRNYQSIGVYHLISVPRIIIGDAAGLGKTLQSLAAFAYLKEANPDLKMLVVASKSALYQWHSEVSKFLTGIQSAVVASGPVRFNRRHPEWEWAKANGKPTYTNVKGEVTAVQVTGAKSRKYQFSKFTESNADILIVNYNTLVDEYKEIIPMLGKYIVIFDEASYFKNTKTLTFRAVAATAMYSLRAAGLSATIIKNRLEEAFSIFSAILPQLFVNVTRFRKTFCRYIFIPLKTGRKMPKLIGYQNLTQFRSEIDPYFIGRRKEDVAKELPRIISKIVEIEMTDKQERAYFDAQEGLIRLATGEEKKIDRLSQLIYCQQIADSPHIVGIDADSSKEDELFHQLTTELVDEKVIIFTNFKKMIDRFEILFKERNIGMTRITGDESSKVRDVNKSVFQDPNSGVNVIFINRAGSESINLQAASAFIFFDNPWSYGDYLQLIGRAQRIGSVHSSILSLHFVCRGTIDHYVIKKLEEKKGLVSTVFGETTMGELTFDNEFVDSVIDDMMKDMEDEQRAG